MKKIFTLILASALFCASGENSETVTGDSLIGEVVKDPAIDSTDIVVAVKDSVQTVDSAIAVELTLWFTHAYCGGARPSEEMTKEYQKLSLLSESTVILRNHYLLKEYECTTNASGIAKLRLEAGKYDIYLTRKINPNLPTGFDPECKVWREKSMGTIKVMEGRNSLSATIHFECNPCDLSVRTRP